MLGKAYSTECCHLFDAGAERLGICLMFATAKKWESSKRKALAAGMDVKQDGHSEGTILLDLQNEQQVRLALKLAGVKQRRTRILTDEQRRAIGERLFNSRRTMYQTPLQGQNSDAASEYVR